MPLGNDVVDLLDPAAIDKHLDSRFVERVLADSEIDWLETHAEPNRWLWTFWSAKEAIYKARAQFDPSPFPGWRHIVVDPGWGAALIGGVSYRVRWQQEEGYVHALAEPETGSSSSQTWHVVALSAQAGGESIQLRSLARGQLLRWGLEVEIPMNEKGSGRPIAYRGGEPLSNVDLSFSHDGRFVAAAIRVAVSSS